MPNLNPRPLLLFLLVTFLSTVIFLLLRKTIETQARKKQVMAKTAQRPARLPFQALARFDYPPARAGSQTGRT